MTIDKLEKGKILQGCINFHKVEYDSLINSAEVLKRHLRDYSLPYFSEDKIYDLTVNALKIKAEEEKQNINVFGVVLSNGTHLSAGKMGVRVKSLISLLEVEAQFNLQEMKRYESELKRL